jgi:hypothetical protein
MIKTILTAGICPVGFYAAPMDFDFEDPKGVNNIIFQLDAPLESTNGTGSGITGTVSDDPDDSTSIRERSSLPPRRSEFQTAECRNT